MITININPIIFSIGSLSVRWYGLMYVVGITIGLLVAWLTPNGKGSPKTNWKRWFIGLYRPDW